MTKGIGLMLMLCSTAYGGTTDYSLGLGGTLGYDITIGLPNGSPIGSAAIEHRGKNVGWYAALESQPTLIYSVSFDFYGIPLAMLTTGPSFGDSTQRMGPYATVGLLGLGGGFRYSRDLAEGKRGRHGIEARLGYYYLSNVNTSLMYRWTTGKKR